MSKLSKAKERIVTLRGARYIAMATQLPFTILAGYALGYFLDSYFGTKWLSGVVLILAAIGGMVQLVWQVLRDQKSKETKNND